MLKITHRLIFWVILLSLLAFVIPVIAAQPPARDFAVAWTVRGGLYVLLPDDAEPRLLTEDKANVARLSPDAAYVAFQRGDSLYAIQTTGGEAHLIFDSASAPVQEGTIASAGLRTWLDADTLLYNTFQYSDFGGYANDDLHIASADGQIVLSAEVGGEFSPSPDGQWIAVTVAGFYGDRPGFVHIVDVSGANPREVMQYTAVATATEGQFAPAAQWVSETVFRVALPVPEMVYEDDSPDAPPVALWEINAETGEALQIGTIPASFFGLPQWNDSGEWLTALTRNADQNLVVMIARGDGSDSVEYTSSVVQGIEVPQWVPGDDRFVYSDNGLKLGGPTMDAPVLLDEREPASRPAVVNSGVVYAVDVNGTYTLFYAPFDGGEPIILATTGDRAPRIHAVSLAE